MTWNLIKLRSLENEIKSLNRLDNATIRQALTKIVQERANVIERRKILAEQEKRGNDLLTRAFSIRERIDKAITPEVISELEAAITQMNFAIDSRKAEAEEVGKKSQAESAASGS